MTDSSGRTVGKQIVIHGREVAYRLEGSGPLIMLVHGMAGSGAT